MKYVCNVDHKPQQPEICEYPMKNFPKGSTFHIEKDRTTVTTPDGKQYVYFEPEE